MPSLKAIRKRISSVKSTQKMTRAMKMVAGARLARAQARIVALRPYAVKTGEMLSAVVASMPAPEAAHTAAQAEETGHPLLVERPEKKVILLVLTSDRGQCGAFNTNINKAAERTWREWAAAEKTVSIYTVGRKGRDYMRRRRAPLVHHFSDIWEALDLEKARRIARTLLSPLVKGEVDAVYIAYNEFKSAMSQRVVIDRLLPIRRPAPTEPSGNAAGATREYLYEPNRRALLDRLVPMYVEITILRALLESMASELGARMTAMDSATKNAKEMIERLTLIYNRARQAAITKELMEIIGGAEALKG
jgi:F-type H+-transporting ATPase subunit gamma